MKSTAEILNPFMEDRIATNIESLIEGLREIRAASDRDWLYEVAVQTHFIVPLLRELGWHPSMMKMEWNKADIVLLSQPFKTLADQAQTNARNGPLVHTIIELKAPHESRLDDAHKQCRGYAQHFPQATRFVTTNGQNWIIEDGPERSIFDIYQLNTSAARSISLLARNSSPKSDVA